MFMLPLMVASGFSGPIAGVLVGRLGLRIVAAGGMGLSAVSFIGLSMLDFSTQQWQAWCLMVLLGFSAASALLASTSAIMAAAPKEKAAAAGAIETMSYELGAGLGIAIFGLLLTRSFSASIDLPQGLNASLVDKASSSIGEAMKVAQDLTPTLADSVIEAAKSAFITSHSVALGSGRNAAAAGSGDLVQPGEGQAAVIRRAVGVVGQMGYVFKGLLTLAGKYEPRHSSEPSQPLSRLTLLAGVRWASFSVISAPARSIPSARCCRSPSMTRRPASFWACSR
jgi:MFS family permease